MNTYDNNALGFFCKIFLIFNSVLVFSCNSNEKNQKKNIESVPKISYKLLGTMPHDSSFFTEGLQFHNGNLFESTGSPDDIPYTFSMFGIIDLKNGKMSKNVVLDGKYFGEGITILKNKIYQLTYKSQVGFIYDLKTLKKIKEFKFGNKEGWGITNDGEYLIMSDGTHILTYLDPNSLQVIKTLIVRENGLYAKEYINELEFIDGYIFANIWQTNEIVKINPKNGEIVGILDGSELKNDALAKYPKSLEMNGIAYDSISKTLLVTGKMWPKFYRLKLL